MLRFSFGPSANLHLVYRGEAAGLHTAVSRECARKCGVRARRATIVRELFQLLGLRYNVTDSTREINDLISGVRISAALEQS